MTLPIIILFVIFIIVTITIVFSKNNKIICKNGNLTPDGKCLCDEGWEGGSCEIRKKV